MQQLWCNVPSSFSLPAGVCVCVVNILQFVHGLQHPAAAPHDVQLHHPSGVIVWLGKGRERKNVSTSGWRLLRYVSCMSLLFLSLACCLAFHNLLAMDKALLASGPRALSFFRLGKGSNGSWCNAMQYVGG